MDTNEGHGGPGRFMRMFFGQDSTCLPTCGEGERSFSLLVKPGSDCPTDISKDNRKEIRDVVVKDPRDFCNAEVSIVNTFHIE